MQNLYERITSLVREREELNRRGGILKYDARRGIPEAKEEYDRIGQRYHAVNDEINRIEKEYVIDIEEMGEIISENLGETYIPTIFKEVCEKNGECYYTDRFIACYINESHPYYTNENYEISVSQDEFKTLVQNLDKTNSIMFSNSGELSYRPLMPRYAFNGTNFINRYTHGYNTNFDNFCRKFIQMVEPMLVKKLESIKVDSVDENLGQGL